MTSQTERLTSKVKVTIYLPRELAERLYQLSRDSRMPVSQIVALALRTLVAPDLTLPMYKRAKARKSEEGAGP